MIKKTVLNALRILISIGILFYVFTRPDVDLAKMLEALRTLPFFNLALALVLYGIVLVFACLRWVILLRSFDIRIGLALAFQLMFIGLFFNNMMPSLTGGDVVKAYYTARGTTKKMEAVASILLDRVFGFTGMFILAAIASIFLLNHDVLGRLARMILMFVGIFFFCVFLFLSRNFWKRLSWLQGWIGRLGWADGLRRFYEALTALRHRWGAAGIVLLFSMMIQGSLVISNFVLAKGLGMSQVSLAQFFVIIPIAGFISAMPISFAGWGIGEGAYRALFMMMNPVYGGIAVALSILYRLTMLSYSLVGFPLYLFYRHGPIENSRSRLTRAHD